MRINHHVDLYLKVDIYIYIYMYRDLDDKHDLPEAALGTGGRSATDTLDGHDIELTHRAKNRRPASQNCQRRRSLRARPRYRGEINQTASVGGVMRGVSPEERNPIQV